MLSRPDLIIPPEVSTNAGSPVENGSNIGKINTTGRLHIHNADLSIAQPQHEIRDVTARLSTYTASDLEWLGCNPGDANIEVREP